MKNLIQNSLKNLKLRFVLYVSIAGSGILIILICGVLFLLVYNWSKEADRLVMANKLADYVITAAGFEAIERGVTFTGLSMNSPADNSIVQKIKELREKGDVSFKKAVSVAEELILFDPKNTGFKDAFQRVKESYKALEDARLRVDAELSKGQKDFRPLEWFKIITNFIDVSADLRQEAIISPDYMYTFSNAISLNMTLKHAVWLASEYAGRERATIGGIIAKGVPMLAADNSNLNSFRAIVDRNMRIILQLKNNPNIDPSLLQSINKMETIFLGKFQNTRKGVYDSAYLGNYTISASQWINESTEAINTILDVSNSASRFIEKQIKEAKDDFGLYLLVLLIILIMLITGYIVVILIIKHKVVEPIYEFINTMFIVEQTGDLRTVVEVNTHDEIGDMTNAFNGMVKRMHDIAKEISIGIERMSSSTGHFSESFGGIVQGMGEQTQKASQVATAAEEMSATVIEVAKNAAGASEAAKEADKAAKKGGDIVRDTVEGMSFLAKSVQGSAEVIAALGERSNEIGKIIKVIDDIADQTNLLALNAAIEAARAGEQGRGFAVVADEVRKLAERTTKATKEIGEMISAIQEDTKKAVLSMEAGTKEVETEVKLARDAGESLKDIIMSVDKVTNMIHHIAAASEQQGAAADQISTDIEAVAGVARNTQESANKTLVDVRDMSDLALELKDMVSKFTMERRGRERTPHERVWTKEERDCIQTTAEGKKGNYP